MTAALLLALLAAGAEGDPDADRYARMRATMVREQIAARGVRDAHVLDALRRVPRHRFVPDDQVAFAYEDRALPIGQGQTISQPYVVAVMTEALALEPGDHVLEIGTGSAYQAAVLAQLVKRVTTIEIVPELAQEAGERLAALGYENVEVVTGDGFAGWPPHAPYDAIIVTAAPAEVPPPLLEQLAVGGRLVIPVGTDHQELRVLTRTERGLETRTLFPVRFVPFTRDPEPPPRDPGASSREHAPTPPRGSKEP